MSTAIQGKLPDDFPGHAALEAADITTYAGVRNVGELTAIPGIGGATAKSIQDAIEAAQAAQAAQDKESGANPATAPETDQKVEAGTPPGTAIPADVMPPGAVFISPDTRITAALSNIDEQIRAIKSAKNGQGQPDQAALGVVAGAVEKLAQELHDELTKAEAFTPAADFTATVATPAPKRLEVHSEKEVPAPGSAARFPYMGVVGEPS